MLLFGEVRSLSVWVRFASFRLHIGPVERSRVLFLREPRHAVKKLTNV